MKAVDVDVSSNAIGGKWLLRLKFLLIGNASVDWLPLFPLILEWSVSQGDTLGLASMNFLFPQLSGPGGSAASRQVASTWKKCLCAPIQKDGKEPFKLSLWRGFQASQPKCFKSDVCVFLCTEVN